jgi:hypothetical protein
LNNWPRYAARLQGSSRRRVVDDAVLVWSTQLAQLVEHLRKMLALILWRQPGHLLDRVGARGIGAKRARGRYTIPVSELLILHRPQIDVIHRVGRVERPARVELLCFRRADIHKPAGRFKVKSTRRPGQVSQVDRRHADIGRGFLDSLVHRRVSFFQRGEPVGRQLDLLGYRRVFVVAKRVFG